MGACPCAVRARIRVCCMRAHAPSGDGQGEPPRRRAPAPNRLQTCACEQRDACGQAVLGAAGSMISTAVTTGAIPSSSCTASHIMSRSSAVARPGCFFFPIPTQRYTNTKKSPSSIAERCRPNANHGMLPAGRVLRNASARIPATKRAVWYPTAHACATSDTNDSSRPEIEPWHEQSINQSKTTKAGPPGRNFKKNSRNFN